MYACVYTLLLERERERERERETDRQTDRQTDRKRESIFVSMCVYVWVCVWVWERARTHARSKEAVKCSSSTTSTFHKHKHSHWASYNFIGEIHGGIKGGTVFSIQYAKNKTWAQKKLKEMKRRMTNQFGHPSKSKLHFRYMLQISLQKHAHPVQSIAMQWYGIQICAPGLVKVVMAETMTKERKKWWDWQYVCIQPPLR